MAPSMIANTDLDRNLISIDPDGILDLLGGGGGQEDAHVRGLVLRSIDACKGIMTPSGAFVWHRASVPSTGSVMEAGGITFRTGKIVRQMMMGSTEVAIFVASAGPGPEALAGKLMDEGNYLEGYIMDLVGTAIVESAAGLLHAQIRSLAVERDMKVTNRYSPGYCTWNVKEQQKLFRLVPGGSSGIVLSGDSLMSPLKSVSGMIGIGKGVDYQEYICDHCNSKDCIYRKPRN